MPQSFSYQFLHVMLRVLDLEKSIAFYQKCFGMKLIRQKDFDSGRFTLAFLGYENCPTEIELTHNWDQKTPYDIGSAYGHIALGVSDIHATCHKLKELGAEIVREPGPMKHGSTLLAFIKDPDGYMIEIIEKN